MAIVIAVLTGTVLILLVYSLLQKPDYKVSTKAKPPAGRVFSICPLCEEGLEAHENVHTVLYPQTKGTYDRLAEIHGCPHCDPRKKRTGLKARQCPVCKKRIIGDGYLVARFFEKPGKKHIHVLGCTSCYARTLPRNTSKNRKP